MAATLVIGVLSGVLSAPVSAMPPSQPTDSFTFWPVADTYVDVSNPSTSYGTSTGLWVDASPTKQALLKFELNGISGRTVANVRLRLYQADASNLGGRIHTVPSTSWSEAVTWTTRPAIDDTALAEFGPVSKGNWYEVDLGPLTVSEGPLALAIQTISSDGARWATRESATPPQLIIDLEPVDGLALDGLSQVAYRNTGSSDPTYYSNNHRLAITQAGRLLAVHGRHAQGVQLAWRNPGGGWQTASRGAVAEGALLANAGTGDWPASIAVARDGFGDEHAWVVWAGASFSKTRSVQLRRISELDNPAGPLVGPLVTIEAPALGAAYSDIAFETAPDGSARGVVAYVRRNDTSDYDLVTRWFTDLANSSPSFYSERVLTNSTTSRRASTLEPAEGGLRLFARGPSGRNIMYGHSNSSALDSWSTGARGITTSAYSYPSAAVLDSGELLGVVESDTTAHTITVQRWSPSGAVVTTDLIATGYKTPVLATDGTDAWLIMIRMSDGFVISRRYTPTSGWEPAASERVEIGAEGGGNYAYPNTIRRTDGRLRILVRGPVGGAGTGAQNAVLAYQRPL